MKAIIIPTMQKAFTMAIATGRPVHRKRMRHGMMSMSYIRSDMD